jgi:tripartite-type tricarboxylate transporter receptor subunit TctC
MISRRQLSVSLASIGLAGIYGPAASQDKASSYPSKPIRVLISVPPGGTMDVLTRAIASNVKDTLGTVILDHKSGANGNIAMEIAKAAEPDGHTLLLGTMSMLAMNPHAYKEFRVDVFKDFEPITLASRFELAVCVHPSVPAKNMTELLAWFKANPSKASMASYGAGTPAHFLIELLAAESGLKIQHVPYRGATQAMQDLMGGQILASISTVGQVIAAYHDKRLNILATTGAKRSPFLPSLPTLAESGFPKLTASAWFSYLAPKGTPKPIIDKLNIAFNKALQSREVRGQLLSNGMYPEGSTPAELAKAMRDDYAFWGRASKLINFTAS